MGGLTKIDKTEKTAKDREMEISEIKNENRIHIMYSNVTYNNWDDSRGTTVGDTYEKNQRSLNRQL